jgi:hypothetical protein
MAQGEMDPDAWLFAEMPRDTLVAQASVDGEFVAILRQVNGLADV